MRPPLCDVCGADVDPADSASLVSCVRAADARESGDLPGHPAHQLWLCEAHRDEGAALGLSRTAAQVVAALREHPEPESGGRDEPALSLHDAVAVLRRSLDRLAGEHGVADVERERSEAREWTPMDHVEPPWCPYIDRRRLRVARDGVELELAEEYAHWNDDELARASATLSLRAPAGAFSLSAHTQGSGDEQRVREVIVTGDAPPWLLDAFKAPHPR
ncbi:hypothetical protein [Microcella sp.]|uniref:hypothetical protein n=1 Tax=Microcella sp. TaxID=1913979 RepID=UPI0025612921|nr:hypothetical protein [Microcella sp.]MBX9471595.1 hypothetical protein [Microcella sp.]